MRSIVITGTSTGIGHACARVLIEHGFRVFGGVRRQFDADRQHPRVRYEVSPEPFRMLMMRILPKRFLDRVIARRLGLIPRSREKGYCAMWKAIVAAAALCLLAAVAEAGDQGDPETSCDGSTYEMVECLKAKTAQWDKRLNIAYQQALKGASSPAQHDKLREAQRLWVQYRDANCQYSDLGEGTIARLDAGECMRRTTEARARELEDLGPK